MVVVQAVAFMFSIGGYSFLLFPGIYGWRCHVLGARTTRRVVFYCAFALGSQKPDDFFEARPRVVRSVVDKM